MSLTRSSSEAAAAPAAAVTPDAAQLLRPDARSFTFGTPPEGVGQVSFPHRAGIVQRSVKPVLPGPRLRAAPTPSDPPGPAVGRGGRWASRSNRRRTACGDPSATTSTRPSSVLRACPPGHASALARSAPEPDPLPPPAHDHLIRRTSSTSTCPPRADGNDRGPGRPRAPRPDERAAVTVSPPGPTVTTSAMSRLVASATSRALLDPGRRPLRRPVPPAPGGWPASTGCAPWRSSRCWSSTSTRPGCPAGISASTSSSWSPASSSPPARARARRHRAASICPASGPAAPGGCCPRCWSCVAGLRAARPAERVDLLVGIRRQVLGPPPSPRTGSRWAPTPTTSRHLAGC